MAVLLLIAGLFVLALPARSEEYAVPAPASVAPINHLLAIVQKDYPGRILEVELEQEDHSDGQVWLYEVKLLTRKGRVYELEYDAVTLKLLNIEGNEHGN